MLQTQEIINAWKSGKVCLVARYIVNGREHVELEETFMDETQGLEYLEKTGMTQFATMNSSYRLEKDPFGNTPITNRTAERVKDICSDMELRGIWRN
jgi:hypothetical protein